MSLCLLGDSNSIYRIVPFGTSPGTGMWRVMVVSGNAENVRHPRALHGLCHGLCQCDDSTGFNGSQRARKARPRTLKMPHLCDCTTEMFITQAPLSALSACAASGFTPVRRFEQGLGLRQTLHADFTVPFCLIDCAVVRH